MTKPDSPVHVAFFGDGEKLFSLSPEMLMELERVTGTGIGNLCRELFAGRFHFLQITETIRLALIGGGETPENAHTLINTYATPRPLMEIYPLAVAILQTAMFGEATTDAE